MKYHSITEAATILRMSTRQIRRYCVRGDIGKKIGGIWIIRSDELKAFVRAPKGRPASATSPQ
jgi:hypothetical protein